MNSKHFFSLLLVLVLVSCSNVSSENIVVSTPPPGATVIPTLTLKVPATLPGVSSDIIHSTGEIVLLDYALSPDGDRLAVYDNTGVFVYKLDTMQKVTLTEFNDSNYSTFLSGAIAFSLDGKKSLFRVSLWKQKSPYGISRLGNSWKRFTVFQMVIM